MKKIRFPRLLAAALSVALLLAPAAQALTAPQARTILENYYVDPVSSDVLTQSSVEAMLEALGDPYTNYLTPDQYAAYTGSMEDGATIGIGIVCHIQDGGAMISNVFPDSPAGKAGLKAGDLITQINGKSVAGLKSGALKSLAHGEEGTQLRVTVSRQNGVQTIVVTCGPMTVPSTIVSLRDGHIGYIDCTTFGPETLQHFSEGMEENSGKVNRWVVDLTNNSGGQLDSLTDALGLFVGDTANLVYFRDKQGRYSAYQSDQSSKTLYPVIVATDSRTASAAELFPAAIRDLRQGIVVGGRTFGKGVAQNIFSNDNFPSVFDDGSAFVVTTHRFFSPKGATNDTVGVIPNLLVPDAYASDVAYLLSATEPGADNTNAVRLDLTWRWFIDLDTALSSRYRDAFIQLLQAIPPDARLMAGAGQGRWQRLTPAELAQAHGLSYQARTFQDTADSPYSRQIDLLATYQLLSGNGDGTFNPGGTLTRAQLCAMLAHALQCRVPTGESQFSDVDMDAWYGPAVNALANMGLVSGTGKGLFQPDAPVDHQQFIVVMSRVAQRLNLDLYEAFQSMPENVSTHANLIPFNNWAKPDVWLLASSQESASGGKLNLLWDKLSNIAPQTATTRGEAAALLYNIFSYTGVLPERVPQTKG